MIDNAPLTAQSGMTLNSTGVVQLRWGNLDDAWSRPLYDHIVALSAANNETGVLQLAGLEALSSRAETEERLVIFSDLAQSTGKMPAVWPRIRLDHAAISGHKFGGPKGVGALLLGAGIDLHPVLRGGGQEMGRRSGTENVIGIAGFGAAAEAALRDLEAGAWEPVERLRNILEERLAGAAGETIFFGQESPRLPNTTCFAVPGWAGETQVMQMDLAGFAVSAGSACSSGKVRESRVLRAMGYDAETARSAIRVSMGPTTTEAEVMAFADAWIAAYEKRRARAA